MPVSNGTCFAMKIGRGVLVAQVKVIFVALVLLAFRSHGG